MPVDPDLCLEAEILLLSRRQKKLLRREAHLFAIGLARKCNWDAIQVRQPPIQETRELACKTVGFFRWLTLARLDFLAAHRLSCERPLRQRAAELRERWLKLDEGLQAKDWPDLGPTLIILHHACLQFVLVLWRAKGSPEGQRLHLRRYLKNLPLFCAYLVEMSGGNIWSATNEIRSLCHHLDQHLKKEAKCAACNEESPDPPDT